MVEIGNEALKPMSISEIIGTSLSIFSRRYFSFVLPFLVISLIEWMFSVISSSLPPIRLHHPILMGIALLEALGSLFLTLFFDAISTGIVTQLAADEFLGRKTNLKKSFNSALDVIVPLIIGIVIVGAIVIVGLILFIIPGIIFLVWFCLTPIVIVLEKRGATDAISRSKELTKDNWFHTLGVLIVVAIIVLIASLIGRVIRNIFALLLSTLLALIVEKVISSFISPIFGIVLTVLYFDLLARKKAAVVPSFPPPTPYVEPEIEVKEVPSITYRYCPYCGSQLPPGAKFCPRCGAAIEQDA